MEHVREGWDAEMIPVVYEDNEVVALNKPAGLIVHPDGKTKGRTLTHLLVEKYPAIKEIGEPLRLSDGVIIDRPGIVHRIDRETSGVLVIAKTQEAHAYLKEQFKSRKVKKEYRVFVYGSVKEDESTIDRPIGRNAKDFRLKSAGRGARGALREAVTHLKVLQRSGEASYLSVQPETGRTHQIRVHLKTVNHPVVCDTLYAPKRDSILGFERLALHALSISLMLPSGVGATFEASLPEDFENALRQLQGMLE